MKTINHDKTEQLLDYFLFILFLFHCAVDCLTGLSKILGFPSPAIPYKFLMMLLMVISIKSFYVILLPILLIIIVIFGLGYYSVLPYSSVTDSLSMMMRIIFYPFMYSYFYTSYRNKIYSKELIKEIICFNFYTVLINQFLGIIGIGVKTYSDGGFGIKGLFFDGNAFSVAIFCMFVYYYALEKSKKKSFLLFCISVMIGTKTAILSIIFYFFVMKYHTAKKIKKNLVLLCFLLILSIVLYCIFYTDLFSYHVEKIKRLYNLFKGNILAVITSGRTIDLEHHFKFYNDNFTYPKFFLGQGYLKSYKIIELDLFDTFFSYGFILTLIITSFYSLILYMNIKSFAHFVFNVLFFLISITAGHVWFNTTACLFFCLINIYQSENEKNLLYI